MRIALSCLVLVSLLVPTVARADDHRMDLYGGGSGGTGGSRLFGFHESLAWVGTPKMKRLSIVLSDFSVQFGKDDSTRVTQVIWATGVRYTGFKYDHKHKPFAQLLVGTVYSNDGLPDANDGATIVGFGYEFVPTPSDEDPKKAFAVRVQADRVFRGGAREDFWRYSVGLMYRFGQHAHPPK